MVDPDSWRLNVTGMVDRPYEMTFDDLLGMQTVERYVTLSCVSNEVGGDLVGNAKWLGVPLRTILNRAGVQDGASQVVGRSIDGFTVGFPTEVALDGRAALVAIGMNDEPLPFDHGFPARLVVPGLYGYVSATKWLTEIELTTLSAFDAYWIPRGWAKRAPIKTQSRIDIPRHLASLDAGPQQAAGFAWAPTRSIEKVEVQLDDGPWTEARLGEALTEDAWRRWVYEFDATSGDHVIKVRATDGEGQTQTSKVHEPRPDGATGHHTVPFGVR
jgi:DMSO/TMAO reductase YedYZ molybdopterin-dependent catalytic subunit